MAAMSVAGVEHLAAQVQPGVPFVAPVRSRGYSSETILDGRPGPVLLNAGPAEMAQGTPGLLGTSSQLREVRVEGDVVIVQLADGEGLANLAISHYRRPEGTNNQGWSSNVGVLGLEPAV